MHEIPRPLLQASDADAHGSTTVPRALNCALLIRICQIHSCCPITTIYLVITELSLPLEHICPFSVVTLKLNQLTSHTWSPLLRHRHTSYACIHTCRCFKILFPATDPYASSLVVLQSLMKYCPQAQIISMPDFVDPCSEASCRYELLYSIARNSCIVVEACRTTE